MRRYAVMCALALTLAGEFAPAQGQSPKQAAPKQVTEPSPRPTRDIAAGGLMLIPDYTLILDSYDVLLTPNDVRATYTITNPTAEARAIQMSFALPDLDATALGDQALAFPKPDTLNFVGATYTADGVAVLPKFEQRALAFGLDVTAELTALGIPLFPYRADMVGRLKTLSDTQITNLLERGIVRYDDDNIVPGWTLKTTAYWRQSFTPGKATVVVLSYLPVIGSGPLDQHTTEDHAKTHCLGAAGQNQIAKRAAGSTPRLSWVTYALTSGSSWTLPATTFRLRIRKPNAETVVASCRKDLVAIGPTVLEWSAQNFYPDDDVAILFGP